MPRAMNEASLRHLGTLFGGGSGPGMSDGQLLERFVTREGTRAERAFEILVERHGPMVQRVARSIVSDRDLADAAFQTVFVTLARRARSLWVRDSIGPWLHAVTVRVATRMRNDQARRRRIDAKAAALMPSSFEPGVPDDLGAALHEEIARLPEAQRLPIVLCLVEGLTHDQAADRLGWPVGTVRSRLARGRERLRSRLDRRGLAPSPGVLIGPGLFMRSGSETITRFPGEEVPPEDTLPDGVLIPLPSSSKMVIRHTAEVHDEVRTRLEQMRRLVTAFMGPPEVVEERLIGPEPTDAEIAEERLIGPESSPFEQDRAREGEAREARGSDPFSPTPDQRSPFELTPDQRNPFERRPAAGPTPDQRIESLERKLDAILDELRAIRGGEKPEGVQGGDNSD